MRDEYTVYYKSTDNNKVNTWTVLTTFDDNSEDRSEELKLEYAKQYADDPNFRIVNIIRKSHGRIDYQLLDRMQAVMDICYLGRKVRADKQIRNRQPLRKATILFVNEAIQSFMQYADRNDYYRNIIADELNVSEVEFPEGDTNVFDIDLKPNFKVLGQKGLGKQAQTLKQHFSVMSNEDKSALHNQLKTTTINVCDIPLTMNDVVASFKAKGASATSKIGTVVLDTELTNELLDRGFLADFRSVCQNLRKEANLDPQDRICMRIYSSSQRLEVLRKYEHYLMRFLLADEIQCTSKTDLFEVSAHKIEVDNEKFSVLIVK